MGLTKEQFIELQELEALKDQILPEAQFERLQELQELKFDLPLDHKGPVIIGLYGCYCHPFDSWDELKYFENQKLEPGDIVKNRCTQEIGEILGFSESTFYEDNNASKPYVVANKKFYRIKYGPLPKDIGVEHVQNLIKQ